MDKSEHERKLIKNIITSIEKYGGKSCLSSIVLTGSFGRGEPTYTINEYGEHMLKSDVEIALIYPRLSNKKMVEKIILKVSAEFEEDLNLMPLDEKRVREAYNFNFSIRVPKYKTIFTYDLFNGSRTIWGKDFIAKNVITLDDVDVYEAKRLVANRIGELVYLQKVVNCEQGDYLRKQWKGKLVLAIVSAWLICERKYVSSYHRQYGEIKKNILRIEKVFGKSFFEEYDKCFKFLREGGADYEVLDNRLIDYVKSIDQYFKEKGLDKPKVNSASRILKYLFRYLKTGMKYKLIGFENNILQALITDYWEKSERLVEDADVWHNVLY